MSIISKSINDTIDIDNDIIEPYDNCISKIDNDTIENQMRELDARNKLY